MKKKKLVELNTLNTQYTCKFCGKQQTSKSYLFLHVRETHTFVNCIDKICACCNLSFKCPIMHKTNEKKNYKKCEVCRTLQKQMKTNDLVINNYVYNQNKRYLVCQGFLREMCHIYTCDNGQGCEDHINLNFSVCRGTKCNNVFVKNEFNFCNSCRDRGDKSKNKHRELLIQTKKNLGGKCVDCGISQLCILDFDHIDPSTKSNQVGRVGCVRMTEEAKKCQLLCRNCHRLKTKEENIENYKHVDHRKQIRKLKRLNYVSNIKTTIGKCQICNFVCDETNTVCFDFDHLEWYNKTKQVSNMINHSYIDLLNEIKKTRFICSNCHTLYNTLTKCSVIGKIYFNEEELKDIKEKYDNIEQKKIHNQELIKICDYLLKQLQIKQTDSYQTKLK